MEKHVKHTQFQAQGLDMLMRSLIKLNQGKLIQLQMNKSKIIKRMIHVRFMTKISFQMSKILKVQR